MLIYTRSMYHKLQKKMNYQFFFNKNTIFDYSIFLIMILISVYNFIPLHGDHNLTATSLIAGVLAAMLHVISGPDHLAAVTPFAIESKKKAWKVGLFWGIGHLLGMLSIGVLFYLFREFIPLEEISGYSEKLVGVILVGLGIWIFYKLFTEEKKHTHTHIHNDKNPVIHKHPHTHNKFTSHKHKHNNINQSVWASLSVGVIHGFAGIAHFLLLLPVLGFASKMESVNYIFGFGIGTITAMVAYAIVVGKIASLAKEGHNNHFFKGVRLVGGLFAFIIGVYWIIVS